MLFEVQERGAYRDFGFATVSDYARERFGFQERKTRYLLFLGRKLKELPQLREALRTGKLGWCKAVRIARVANREDETMWLDSALSLSVQELDKRLKDQTERLAGMIQFWVSEDVRVLWENALEVARRTAGVKLSPAQAFEYLIAEFPATWGGVVPSDDDDPGESDDEDVRTEPEALFPIAEKVAIDVAVPTGLTSDVFRAQVLERDGWQCRYPGCSSRRELHVHTSSSGSREVATSRGTA